MKPVRFSEEKNKWLKQKRGIDFERIIKAIKDGNPVKIIKHPNKKRYKNQKIYLVLIEKYIFLVPAVEEKEYVFFKTIYPSHKYTKIFFELKVKKEL